jgi:plasmid stabilization system protein ParE
MVWSVALTEHAERDLEQAVAFLARKNPEAAERGGLGLVAPIFSLDRMPHRGPAVRGRPGYRRILHRPWFLIVYRLAENTRRAENWPEAEALATRLLFDRPADFWNLKKLADTFRSDRAPSLRELRTLFLAHLLSHETRDLLTTRNFASLRTCDPALYECVKKLGAEAVANMADYVHRTVPLDRLHKAG